jgi:DNA-binding MarR family transcriptional regulator
MSTKKTLIDHSLRATWQAVSKMYSEVARQYGITMALGLTLLNIDPKNGTASTALGPIMGMEPTSLSRLINSLEDLHLVERKPNPHDGRGVIVHLTSDGLTKRDFIKKHVYTFNEAVANKVSQKDLLGFYNTIDAINSTSSEQLFDFQQTSNTIL